MSRDDEVIGRTLSPSEPHGVGRVLIDRDASTEARRCEEHCARFEGVARACKDDVEGVARRQAETHATIGAMKDHVKLIDTIADKALSRADSTLEQTSKLVLKLDACLAAITALAARVETLEKTLDAMLPPAN